MKHNEIASKLISCLQHNCATQILEHCGEVLNPVLQRSIRRSRDSPFLCQTDRRCHDLSKSNLSATKLFHCIKPSGSCTRNSDGIKVGDGNRIGQYASLTHIIDRKLSRSPARAVQSFDSLGLDVIEQTKGVAVENKAIGCYPQSC